jgi:hypothetical protein
VVVDRTFIFANAAANTKFRIKIGEFQKRHVTVTQPDLGILKPDCLGRCGADLFTDYALCIHGPGQTASPVIKGSADLDWLLIGGAADFLFHAQRDDGPCRAYLTAEDAIEFTVSYLVHEDRCPEPFEPPLEK